MASDEEIERLLSKRQNQTGFSGDSETAEEFMEQGVAGVFPLYRYLWEPSGAAAESGLENASHYAEQFRSGPFFAGIANRYGAGTYFIPYRGLSGPAIVLKAALREEAHLREETHIIAFPALAEQMRADGLNPAIPEGHDPGYYAACRRSDAFLVQDDYAGNFYTVVFNHTALVVCSTDVVKNGSS